MRAFHQPKKKLLGGWNVLITNCPDCCVEEMNRLNRVRKQQRKREKDMKKKEKGIKKEKSMKKDKSEGKKKVRGDNNDDRNVMEGHQQRSRSRSRVRRPQDVDGAKSDVCSSGKSHRSKSRQGRSSSTNAGGHNESQMVFEFDIPLDAQGDVTSPQQQQPNTTTQSIKSRKSQKSSSSKQSRKSSKSVKTNKSSKSTRTNKSGKSTRSTRTSKSTQVSRRSSSRSKSKSRDRKTKKEETVVVSRGSQRGSSQRFIRQPGGNLRVAKMPFKDKYNREGKYTGEINSHGQPHGQGTLRYNNGTVHEGLWNNGQSDDMDMKMARASQSGFTGDWKNKTKVMSKMRKEQDMDDIRSFISQSVRSGMTGSVGGGSQQGSLSNNSRRSSPAQRSSGSGSGGHGFGGGGGGGGQHQHGPRAGHVTDMPWSDVNGFNGVYTGEINSQNVPDGRGYMRYSNGVVEEGMFCNGVYQPPTGPAPVQYSEGYGDDDDGIDQEGGAVPSSSMSVWSLKSSPTMALNAGGHNVLTGQQQQQHNRTGGASSVIGAPSSVHLGPSGLYGNVDRRY